LLLTGMATWL